MEVKLVPIFTIVSVTLAVVAISYAALSPEAYWKSVLPNTPIPKAVEELLHPDKSTSVEVGKVLVGVDNYAAAAYYAASAAKDQLHDNPNTALFFLEKDMTVGTKMTLHFPKSSQSTTLLPRPVADKIPFSSKKFSQIQDHFSLKPNSAEAEIMKKSIKQCEEPGIKGEEKYCATSLESMIDFCRTRLGKKVSAIATEVGKERKLQKYSIIGIKQMPGHKIMVCHKQNYAYTVFYCHESHTTEAYVVSLASADGTRVKAATVCHKDTSAWNPKHLAFQVLKVKPGTVPVCHFLPEDHLLWVPNY